MSAHTRVFIRHTQNADKITSHFHLRCSDASSIKRAIWSRSKGWVAPSRRVPSLHATDWSHPEKHLGQSQRSRHAGLQAFLSNGHYITTAPSRMYSSSSISQFQTLEMTTASFKHIDTASYAGKPWSKVDGPGNNFKEKDHTREVINLRGKEHEFTTDNSGFTVYSYPAKEKMFTDEAAVREGYYHEVENMLRDKIPGIKKVVIFDHTIRRRKKDSPRQPVQQVHVDQTPGAAEARVRRHLPSAEADELVKGRYQIINVWRPIENPASDHPLAVIDWRSTSPDDFIPTDLMYPKRADSLDVDDRGKEVLPDPNNYTSTEGYEVRGETMAVAPSEKHKFYYMKDMTPEEVLLLKCFDSWGEGMPNGKKGLAVRTPHTAFADPATPADAPGRQSIEVRCLVFYQ